MDFVVSKKPKTGIYESTLSKTEFHQYKLRYQDPIKSKFLCFDLSDFYYIRLSILLIPLQLEKEEKRVEGFVKK